MMTRLSDIARSRKGFLHQGGCAPPDPPSASPLPFCRSPHGPDGEGLDATFSSIRRVVPAKVRRTSRTPCQTVAKGKPEVVGGWSSVKPLPPEIQNGGLSRRPARR